MVMINARSISLETLVRTALTNGELAPGVAKQISLFRTELASKEEVRLLAVLDDAIANNLVKVIELVGNQSAVIVSEKSSLDLGATGRVKTTAISALSSLSCR